MMKLLYQIVPSNNAPPRTIAALKMWNDGTGTPSTGNYQYELWLDTITFKGSIKKFPRKKKDALDLLQKVISDVQKQRSVTNESI